MVNINLRFIYFIKMVSGGVVKLKVFTDTEKQLLQDYFNDQRHNLDVALLEVLYQTGCRCIELCRIRPRDLDKVNSTIRVYGAKGSDGRIKDVKPELIFVLLDLAARAGVGADDPIIRARRIERKGASAEYVADRQWVERHWDSLQEKLFGHCSHTVHTFRHNHAKGVFLISGKNIKAVQMALGHKSATSTLLYLNYFLMDELKPQLKKLVGY
jgi:integrase